MRAVSGAILAIILVVPSLSFQSMASDWPGQSSPRVEWRLDLPPGTGSTGTDFTDLDSDGIDEIAITWGRNCTLVNPPDYDAALSLADPALGWLRYFRFANATTRNILVPYQTESHFNVSIIAGDDFKDVWRSPDIEGHLAEMPSGDIGRDIDGDGRPEIVLPIYNGSNASFEVFDAVTHDLEWTVPRTNNELPYIPYFMQELDDDPALELLTAIWDPNLNGTNPISAYDGATREKQWTISLPGDFYFLPAWERFFDIDNDSENELVLPYVSRGGPENTTSGLNVYSAATGALEWGIGPEPGRLIVHQMEDINGDGWQELLMEKLATAPDGIQKGTYSIFAPKENRTLWTSGPFGINDRQSHRVYIEDLELGTPELIMSNTSEQGAWGSTVTYQVHSAQDFSLKWTSPEEWNSGYRLRTYRPSENAAPRLILIGNRHNESGHTSSTLKIVSTADYQVLFNATYDGQLHVSVEDWDGDFRPELFLSYYGVELLDGNDLHLIWKAGWYGMDGGRLAAADLCGGPGYEILKSSVSGGYRTTNGTSAQWYASVISVHGQPALGQIWASQSLDGMYSICQIADLDNDSNTEALFRVHRYDQPFTIQISYVMIEFPREPPTNGNPWPPGINLRPPTISIDKPKNNQKVTGTVKISGTAEDDTSLARVMVRIDDDEWMNASWWPGSGNLTCVWNHSWDSSQASKGAHTIYARAFDGTSWSSESSVTVEVRPPGTATPGWPGTTIASFPDPACLILIVVALIAAVTAFLVHRRRK